MEVLILQRDEDLRARLTFALESRFAAKIYEAGNLPQAAQIVGHKKKLDLLIYDLQDGALDTLRPLLMVSKDIPWIFCSSRSVPDKELPKGIRVLGIVERGNMLIGMIDLLSPMVNRGELRIDQIDRNFCRIKTKLLLSVSPLKSDIYIKLSDSHYVKLFHQGDIFDKEDLEKYTTRKGVEYLYLKADETSEFIAKYQTDLGARLNKVGTSIRNQLLTSNELHETAQSLISTMGFTPEIQELAKSQVKMTVQAVRRNPSLAELWKNLHRFKGQYLHTHSTLCAYISCSIAANVDWASDSTYHKLSLASFMHDITISNGSLAKLRNIKELEAVASKFTPDEIRQYKNHPNDVSEMLAQIPLIPPDVDMIVMQHHEWPDGSGFPRQLSHTHIHPLAAVFIVAHDLVDQMIDGKVDPRNYVETNHSRFVGSQFKKILNAMAKALREETE